MPGLQKCAYFMCTNTSAHKSMFSFPCNEKNRLRQWIDNCGNTIIAHLPAIRLRSRFLCIDHFECQYVRNENGGRKRLLKTAVPKPFQDPGHSAQTPSHPSSPASKAPHVHARSTHEDINCNECGDEVVGFRYTCVECADYDLCASCEARGAHAQHYVLRIPMPRPPMEIVNLVRKIRSELESGLISFQIDTDSADSNEESIKIEIKDEVDIERDPLQEADVEIKSEPPESPGESAIQPSSSTSNILQIALLDAGIKKTDEPVNTPKKRPAPQTTNKHVPKKAKTPQVLPNRKVVKVRRYSGPSSEDSPMEAPRNTGGFFSEVFTHRAKNKPTGTVQKRML